MKVAVVGAGIAGLCAAIGLRSAGAEVVVLERAEELRPVGSGLSIFPNGAAALSAVGLAERFHAITGTAGASLAAGQRRPDGRWLARLPEAAVSGLRVVHRSELHDMLVHALPSETLYLGTTVTDVREEGTVVDMAGPSGAPSSEAFDVVVAADGVNSAVRRSWPKDPGLRYSGYSSWRGVTGRPVDLHGVAGETWGRGLRFGMAPLRTGQVYWFAVATMAADEKVADEYGRVRELFAAWHDPIPALLNATAPEDVFRLPINDLARPLHSFRSGSCVLLGDAAHAMTPDLGQGANQAMEDAATLTALLSGVAARPRPAPDALEDALARYDLLRRKRTQAVARRSRALGALAHLPTRPGVLLRDAVLRLTPPAALARQAKAVQAWAPPAVEDTR